MAGSRGEEQYLVTVDYTVLDGEARSATLAPGEAWTFGRGGDCSQTLSLPSLSRIALALEHLSPGVVRVTSRQSNLGRVLISSDDDKQHHTLRLGSGPVHLTGGNYTVKVELPPIVLRMLVAVPHPQGRAAVPPARVSPRRLAERTAVGWTPRPGSDADERNGWLTVVALAVALHRYPELVPREGATGRPVKMSEALRRACAAWCGHTSLYWVNERLKEAVEAADLVVTPGGERLGAAVAHYEQLFSDRAIRVLRDALAPLLIPSHGA